LKKSASESLKHKLNTKNNQSSFRFEKTLVTLTLPILAMPPWAAQQQTGSERVELTLSGEKL